MASSPDYEPQPFWSRGSTIVAGQAFVWTLLYGLAMVFGFSRHDYLVFAVIALNLALHATLAGWLALGDGSLVARLALVLVAVAAEPLTMRLVVPDPPLASLLERALSSIAVWAAPLAVLRLNGWSCRVADDAPAAHGQWFQFGIKELLAITTLTAVLEPYASAGLATCSPPSRWASCPGHSG
jgi:hypothetical protein